MLLILPITKLTNLRPLRKTFSQETDSCRGGQDFLLPCNKYSMSKTVRCCAPLSASSTHHHNHNHHHHHHHHHQHICLMELGHFLTRSSLTYPGVSSKVYHDLFCQLGSSISLPWVIYFEAFYLHAVSIFSFIPVICPKLVLF